MMELLQILALIEENPLAAADELEAMAARLVELATELRKGQEQDGVISLGGIGDKVRMAVIGPKGDVKGFGGTN